MLLWRQSGGVYPWGLQLGYLAPLLPVSSELEKCPASAMEPAFSASCLYIFWPLGSMHLLGEAALPMRNNLGNTQGTFVLSEALRTDFFEGSHC